MDALKIAFETVIIGALTLPWLLLALDLFVPPAEKSLWGALDSVQDHAVAAVLLFAVTYFMGAAMSRLAGDFFNDDDLGIAMTEDAIRYKVYSDPDQDWPGGQGPELNTDSVNDSVIPATGFFCSRNLQDREKMEHAIRQTRRFFEHQESTLLLLGSDKIARLQHVHQQLLVLRGAALNGIILTVLFLFGFCVKQKPWGTWLLIGISIVLTVPVVHAMVCHFTSPPSKQHFLIDPPLMEISLLLVVTVGFFLAWKGPGEWHARRPYGRALLISGILTFIAYTGWWWTEVIYDELVINMFNAQSQGLLKTGP